MSEITKIETKGGAKFMYQPSGSAADKKKKKGGTLNFGSIFLKEVEKKESKQK